MSEQIKSVIHSDERLSQQDEKDILIAREEISCGDFVRYQDIDWS